MSRNRFNAYSEEPEPGDELPPPRMPGDDIPPLPGQPDTGRRVGRPKSMFDMAVLDRETLGELRERAKDLNVAGASKLKKDDLIIRLMEV